MKNIKELSDSFPGCSRVYMLEDTFDRLPKLIEALYPLVEQHRVKITYNKHLMFDKTIMVDDSDIAHFRTVCKYRIEDAGGGEYVLAEQHDLSEYLFALYDAYPASYARLNSGELFIATGYVSNVMTLDKRIVVTNINHPHLEALLTKAIDHLNLSSTVFNVTGLTSRGQLHIDSFSSRVRDFVNRMPVEYLTEAFDVMLRRSF